LQSVYGAVRLVAFISAALYGKEEKVRVSEDSRVFISDTCLTKTTNSRKANWNNNTDTR